jgi:TolA-binding protein
MKSFNEYKEKRVLHDLATILVVNEVDFYDFAELCLTLHEHNLHETVLLNELLAGLGALAKKGAAVGQGVQSVVQGVKQVGQNIANTYISAEQQAQINKVIGQLKNLKNQLGQMGFNNPQVTKLFDQLVLTLKQGSQAVQQDPSLRFAHGNVFNVDKTGVTKLARLPKPASAPTAAPATTPEPLQQPLN